MMFHSAGDDIRKVYVTCQQSPSIRLYPKHALALPLPQRLRGQARRVILAQAINHPAPIQSLRNFERVRVPAGTFPKQLAPPIPHRT